MSDHTCTIRPVHTCDEMVFKYWCATLAGRDLYDLGTPQYAIVTAHSGMVVGFASYSVDEESGTCYISVGAPPFYAAFHPEVNAIPALMREILTDNNIKVFVLDMKADYPHLTTIARDCKFTKDFSIHNPLWFRKEDYEGGFFV